MGLKSKVQENLTFDGIAMGAFNELFFFGGKTYPFLTSSIEWIDFNL